MVREADPTCFPLQKQLSWVAFFFAVFLRHHRLRFPLVLPGKKRTIRGMVNDLEQKMVASGGQAPSRPFRRALLRGLAVLSPPLLTVLIVVWAINTTKSYFLEPVTSWAREGLVWSLKDVRTENPNLPTSPYVQIPNGTWIPQRVADRVKQEWEGSQPTTGDGYYRAYVDVTFLQPHIAIPFFLAVFVLFLYFLGKFMAAGIGRFFAGLVDRLILRLPGVRGVYSAVKQVSDFVFSEREIQVTRIVAVEFPRKGIWSMGFVTGESLLAIGEAAGEPVVAVLIPYSPVPVTGCTITVLKRDCLDLDITFDQACQFIVSCGVVVPPHQMNQMRGAS